jgi:hypothetical protein
MASGVGPILREARNRREIDLAAVEAATRIRLRFLRAIENEEWDVLPGGVYTRGFIRTYAAYLGLDGDRLAEDYRREVEAPGGEREPGTEHAPASAGAGTPGGRRSVRRVGWIAIAAVASIAALAIVALPGGGDGGGGDARQPSHRAGAAGERERQAQATQPRRGGVSVHLAANAEVWVCVLDAAGRHLVDGQILAAGAEKGPLHSGSFTVSLGNGEVSMLIDGKEAEIPATSSPIGYSIDSSGTLTELDEAERPTCL